VDDAAKELFQHAEEALDDAQDFPSEPCDTSMLTAYADHVVVIDVQLMTSPIYDCDSHTLTSPSNFGL